MLATLGVGGNSLAGLRVGLVALWHLEEASGARADAVGANTLTSNNNVGQVAGKVGQAAALVRASSQYLSIADNAALSMGTGVQFTLAAWVQFTGNIGTATELPLVAKGSPSVAGGEYILTKNASDQVEFRVRNPADTTNAAATTTPLVVAGAWYWIVAWYDGANLTIQQNNGAPDLTVWAADVLDGSNAFQLGRRGATGQYHDGYLDEVALWKRALTAGERTQLWNGGAGVRL